MIFRSPKQVIYFQLVRIINLSPRAYLLLTLLLFIRFSLTAQTNTNSLKQLLNQKLPTAEELNITLRLSENLYKTNATLALEYAYKSEQLAKKLHADSLLNHAYNNQATAQLYLGNHPKALQLFLKAIQGAKKFNDSHLLFLAYENLGILYYYEKDHQNALKYLFAAHEQYNRKKPASNYEINRNVYVLNNIGIVYNDTKRFNEATLYFNEALKQAKQLNDHELIANVLTNMGSLLNNKGNPDSALKLYLEALEIRQRLNNKWGLCRSYLSLGQFYLDKKEFDKAEHYLQNAISTGKEVKFWQNIGTASLALIQLYKQTGDYEKALKAIEFNKTVNDTLYNEERTRKIAQLEMQFDFDRQQAEVAAQQRQRNIYYLLGGISLMLSIIIVTLLFYLQKNKAKKLKLEQATILQEKHKLEKDIVFKEREIAANLFHLSQKKGLIDDISAKLQNIKQDVKTEAQPSVQKLISDLHSNLQADPMQEFELRFQQVHNDFYAALDERFPDLTPSERKLCAFLKLNMSSKEISVITHQNIKSIEIARTRLRKKLELTGSSQNLTEFLTQF